MKKIILYIVLLIIAVAGVSLILQKQPASTSSVHYENGIISVVDGPNKRTYSLKVSDYAAFIKDSYPAEGDGYTLDEYELFGVKFVKEVNQVQVEIADPVNFGAKNPSSYVIWSNLDGSNKRVVYYRSNTNIGGAPDVSPGGHFFVVDVKQVMSACRASAYVDYARIDNGGVGTVISITELNGKLAMAGEGEILSLHHGQWLGDNEVEIIAEYYDSRCNGELVRTESWGYNLETKESKLIK